MTYIAASAVRKLAYGPVFVSACMVSMAVPPNEVVVGPGLDDDHVDAERLDLQPQRVADRFDGVLAGDNRYSVD